MRSLLSTRRGVATAIVATAIVAGLGACGATQPGSQASPPGRGTTTAMPPAPPPTTSPSPPLSPHPPATSSAVPATSPAPPASSLPASATRPAGPGLRPVTGWLTGKDWTVIPTSRRVVALTFDAGANADAVPSILATLRREGVPATFFLTGNFARDFPAAARSIAAAGLRIGDHTVSHLYLTKLSDAAVRQEILGGAAQITAVTGQDPVPLLRFPFGDASARVIAIANQAGYVPVRWTIDTLGWEGTAGHITPAVVVSRVLDAARPGEIVLMHAGSNPDDHTTFDAGALPAVISGLRAQGYSFVTLDALTG
jgi:peptidoglycan/xylan/chitin deacetylase (PgdA/CDA1 family)